MPDTASILSPTGAVFAPNWPLPGVNGVNSNPGYVSRPVPGVLLATQGLGQFQIQPFGFRGTLTAEIVTGAAGTARAVLSLRDTLASPQYEVRIALDNQNRPTARVVVAGVAVAVWTPTSAAIAAGTPLQLRLIWDSLSPHSNFAGVYVDFELFNGSFPGLGSWTTAPSAPFVMAPMGVVLTGFAASFGDFNGAVNSLQVGTQTFSPQNAEIADNLAATVVMGGGSSFSANAELL